MTPKFFESQSAFHAWLDKNHATAGELLVGFHKKTSGGGGLTYQEALDEALAYGWIDGVRRRVDDHRWTIRFTPRKPRSIWSTVNTARVKELIKLGRMMPAGVRAFEARDPKRSGIYGHERETATLDPTLAKALRANAKAAAFFAAQPPGYRKIITHWIMSGKREDTRMRRLGILIDHSERGARIDFMKPTGAGGRS
jgi:uncharacterized protein YdeI (YjbR/CyaY-like superfamily)